MSARKHLAFVLFIRLAFCMRKFLYPNLLNRVWPPTFSRLKLKFSHENAMRHCCTNFISNSITFTGTFFNSSNFRMLWKWKKNSVTFYDTEYWLTFQFEKLKKSNHNLIGKVDVWNLVHSCFVVYITASQARSGNYQNKILITGGMIL